MNESCKLTRPCACAFLQPKLMSTIQVNTELVLKSQASSGNFQNLREIRSCHRDYENAGIKLDLNSKEAVINVMSLVTLQ